MAISQDDRILANVVYSQIEVHKKWGGVVPQLARVSHEENIQKVIDEALKRARLLTSDKLPALTAGGLITNVDAVAVTVGPGLAIALGVGIAKAKEICAKYNKKLIAVNHMEGHLLSPLIMGERKFEIRNSKFENTKVKENVDIKQLNFPGIGLLISGGHTQLVRVNGIGEYEIIGDTLDDAAGEAFDKVAKMLELGYPGGEIVERLAKEGEPIFKLPTPMLKSHDLNFSFSGLKTAAMYFLQRFKGEKNRQFICDFCASFQFVLIDSIRRKLEKCLRDFPAGFLLCGGGVMNNLATRKMIRQVAKAHEIPAFFPAKKAYNSDNAAMIALAGFFKAKRGEFAQDLESIDRRPNWEIDEVFN